MQMEIMKEKAARQQNSDIDDEEDKYFQERYAIENDLKDIETQDVVEDY